MRSNAPPAHWRALATLMRACPHGALRERMLWRLDRELGGHGWSVEKWVDDIRWYLDLDDLACRMTYLADAHEAETPAFLRRLIKPGDTVWDVGACHGFVSLRMAHLAGATGRVHAFEPVSLNRNRFLRNLNLNPALTARVNLHPFALSDASGRVLMQRTSPANPGASYIIPAQPAVDKGRSQAGELGREEVETRRGEVVWQETGKGKIDGVKIDVEGHELRVLAGMEELMRSAPPRWFLSEVRDSFLRAAGSSKEELFAWFKARGYDSFAWAEGGKLRPVAEPCDASAILFLKENETI